MGQPDNTLAFIIDERTLRADVGHLRTLADDASCKLLYSPKANALAPVLEIISEQVDGFGCSSINELRLTDTVRKPGQSLHLVSPLIEPATLRDIGERLDYVTFNSLSQWARLRHCVSNHTKTGLRVNPQMSFVGDARYDPCRRYSKLGIPIHELAAQAALADAGFDRVRGLHFHNNCESTDFAAFLATARHIRDVIPELLERVDWINMGGGYLFDQIDNRANFFEAVAIFREEFSLEVFIEPGAAMVRRAATIVATVHDIFESDEMQIAVLDAAVNHMPEVFEFQFEPDILGHVDGGMHAYMFVGCTCLAGDVFGEYAFDAPLSVGARVTFLNMGAYTLSKAHRFNGVGLPAIYKCRPDGVIELIGEDSFEDFARSLGADVNAIV